MKVLFDTNVVLDVLLDRRPFSPVASRLFARVERETLTGVLGATTLTTVHYLVTKARGRDKALQAIRDLLALFHVAPVDRHVLESAASSPIEDFEDAVLHEAGRQIGADSVVTRDPEDFRHADLAVYSPEELEAALGTVSGDTPGEEPTKR